MWVDFCRDLGYITDEVYSRWQDEMNIIVGMLHKMREK